MSNISAGNGYFIECLEGGYKILKCPDDIKGKMGNGISADSSITLGQFKKICKDFIQNRKVQTNLKTVN